MKVRLFPILAALLCSCVPGCTTVRYMEDISQVSYTSASGTILPELQWYEEIVITTDKVTLARNGTAADTEINAGTWDFAVDEHKVTAFFGQLEAIDCSSIREVEPDEPTEGGGTETYTVVYAGGKTFHVRYGQGTTYTDGTLIVKPIHASMDSLALPAGAANRYKSSTDPP